MTTIDENSIQKLMFYCNQLTSVNIRKKQRNLSSLEFNQEDGLRTNSSRKVLESLRLPGLRGKILPRLGGGRVTSLSGFTALFDGLRFRKDFFPYFILPSQLN